MERTKIFTTNAAEKPKAFQDEINSWLCAHDGRLEITGRLQSQSNYRLVITIFYKLAEDEDPGK